MAATPFPFFFPTTAPAYAPTTIFPPPPFGFRAPTYGAPPTFSYAAAYPYPHGASAYAPVPDFPYPLALAPLPASTAPPATLHTTPGHPIHSIHHHHFPPTSVVPDHDSSKAACAPVTSTKGSIATAGEDLSFILVDTKPPHHSRVGDTATNRVDQVSKDTMLCQASAPAFLESTEAQAREEATISEHMSQAQSSFDSLQAELSKLRYRLSSLATSMVPSSSSSTSTTERITSVPAMSAFSVPAAPAYVAPQVFAEMATPTSEKETQGTTSNFCSGQLNPIQMSCVSNLNEQNLDEMPQPYGFHSLDRHSVFLVDGTEHSYYALPESYPCEQAILAPVFDVYDDESNGRSNEFVQVFAGTPEQQTNSVEKQASHQAPDCFSKPTFCPERPTVGVFNLGNEPNPDNEPTAVCVNQASANAFSQDTTDFTSILVSCLIVDGPIKCNVRNLKTELYSLPVSALCYTHGKPKQCNMQLSEQGREVWDPGATDLPIRFTTGAGATDQQGIDVYRSARQHIPADTHDKEQMTQEIGLTSTYFSKAAEIGQTSACLSYNSEILDCTLEQQHQVNEKASVNAQQLRAHPWNVLVIDETRTEWHPGDHTIRLLFYSQGYVVAKREIVQWDPGIGTHSSMYFWLPGLTARIVTRKPLSWLQNSELATWQSLMTSASSVWDPGVHIYLYSWLNILLVWAAADKQLSCTHISDLASWRNQLVCNAASSIWDAGIDSLMLVYICLHLHMTQLGGSSATHACYLPSALLPHIHIVSYGSSNSKAGELTFRCLVFHLQQSNNRTSTISHGITSYAYTMKFIHDQLELVHQQGVQKNYNAKSLISSQNYLQLSEGDIIFTTFLPP